MVRVFDADRQEWAGPEEEQQVVALQRRDAARQRQALRGAAVVLAVCGLAFGTWALGWKDEPGPVGYFTARDAPPAQTTDTDGDTSGDSGGTGTEDPASPGPTDTLPPEYEAVQDPEGFRVAVRKGWDRQTAASVHGFDIVNYRSADGSRRIQIYEVLEATPDASLQEYVSDSTPKPEGFEQLSLESLDDGGYPAARLEYLADSLKGETDNGTWHIVDHRFESMDGKLYAITSYGPAADGYDDERTILDTALNWFCPPATQCPEPVAD
ncbi:hypothetical protein G5C60_32865 [Streptomyces sp. HC44]|uniref:Serine/arginine repetitive matrix protein 2 n=1 Tax=Streptomyces scabichelini TaxID=2711217 RepID=A0A6G4VER5_9ACTN|nr:hypothetical protein [Streptomyces scabichelini]NGO12273.1 hypothetical protein [Streptomyces scabichelini]